MIAWLAHLYTASGAVLAFLAAADSTDGVLARRLRVKERLPWFNGAKLDDIVDYLCYVFIPALFVWRALLVPDRWSVPVVAAMLLSSAYGFNRQDAKTADNYFLGFPSYWNIVVFYLFVAQWPPALNAAILVALAALVFVPVRYLYPSRGAAWQAPTLGLAAIWAVLMIVMLWQFPAVSRPVFLASLAFPAYYMAVSLWLEVRRRRGVVAAR